MIPNQKIKFIKCLHICNDLIGSKVHENLYNYLNNHNLEQEIYYPVRQHTKKKILNFDKRTSLNIIYSKPLKRKHRYFFRNKIKFLYRDLQSKTNLSDYELIDATTLFSDGALALNIFNDYRIPYVVKVRGTDINLFMKYRIDLYPLAKKILKNASKIIFISPSLENNFFKNPYIRKLENSLKEKSLIIPNGLDSFWLNNMEPKKTLIPYKLLYIGKFNKNKNVLSLIKGYLKAKKHYPNLTLELVGKGGSQEKEIMRLSNNHQNEIKLHGPINNKGILKQIYQTNHIFAMTSIGETFGLVYVEALSQGLPILYSQNQGIDGVFNKYIGESVNPKSVDSISEGIEKMISNYNEYELDKINLTDFSWEKISANYLELYTSNSK